MMFSEKDREIQRRMMEAKMQRCELDLDRARVASTTGRVQEVDRVLRNVRAQLQDPLIPRDFFMKSSDLAKKIELDAHTKLVDMSLEQAREAALRRADNDKAKAIKTAKEALQTALKLGAGQGFKDIVTKKIDVISMTGGHKAQGPTIAKPAEVVPKLDNKAKSDLRNYRRYENPKLSVKLPGDKVFTTIDWSIGGMLVGGYEGDLEANAEVPIQFHLLGDSSKTFTATVRVVRRGHKEKELALRFIRATMDALEFFKNLIKAQGERT